MREAIPLAILRFDADPSRVAIGGISMGGFGALDLARLAPSRFCAVGGHSAALWRTGGETPAGAFDDASDFARHDLLRFAGERRLFAMPVWIDGGSDDPFRSADTALVGRLRRHGVDVAFHIWSGGHATGYWDRHMRAYLEFYARALAAC